MIWLGQGLILRLPGRGVILPGLDVFRDVFTELVELLRADQFYKERKVPS